MVRYLTKEEPKVANEQRTIKTSFVLILGLKKFGLNSFNPTSVLSLTALFDPHSRELSYIPDDESRAALKEDLLQQLIVNNSNKDTSAENSETVKEVVPAPKKKKKTKDKDLNWIFWRGFFR